MDWARILAYPVDVCGCSSEVFYASLAARDIGDVVTLIKSLRRSAVKVASMSVAARQGRG